MNHLSAGAKAVRMWRVAELRYFGATLVGNAPNNGRRSMNYSSRAFDIDYTLDRDGSTATVSGTLVNKLEREVSTVLLSFHFYDGNDVRVNQEQLFVNEVEPEEKVRFCGNIFIGGNEIQSVKLIKAEPIPTSDYPELAEP